MKRKLLCAGVALCCLWSALGAAAGAASRYTDKENALNLAEALDKGAFKNRLITATFIQSVGKGQYFIKAILENGAEHNWNFNRLRALSRQEALVLKNNQALLFVSETSNDFAVFDKSRFARMALSARVYVKHYRRPDVLSGQKIAYGIHRFNLVRLLGLRPERDASGYRHHYVLDLENGQRELLSYLDAYRTLARNALLSQPDHPAEVMRSPYRMRTVQPRLLKQLGPSGTGMFAVELVFDRAVGLQPGHFPFRFYENGAGSRRGGKPGFVVEVTFPNTVLENPLTSIDSLEFLRNVRMVPDNDNPLRVLMRAGISSDVVNFPPEVEVDGAKVRVAFTKVVDQSVFDKRTLEEKALRLRQDRLLHRRLSPAETAQREAYHEQMKRGQTQLHRARRAKAFQPRHDAYRRAMAAFQEAAAHASTDLMLEDALRARNVITIKLPSLVIDHVRAARQKGASLTPEMQTLLDEAALLTRDQKLLDAIQTLR